MFHGIFPPARFKSWIIYHDVATKWGIVIHLSFSKCQMIRIPIMGSMTIVPWLCPIRFVFEGRHRHHDDSLSLQSNKSSHSSIVLILLKTSKTNLKD